MPHLHSLLKSSLALTLLILAGCASAPPTMPESAPTEPAPKLQASVPETPTAPAPVVPAFGAKIGLLLPLSGRSADLGRNLHQAAELGLFETADDTITLMVENTAPPANPESAARMLIARGANILVGPIFGADLKRITTTAQNARIPILAFTNDVSLAKSGIYVMGVSPAMEVDRVLSYAMAQGLRRVAVLAPNSPYGSLVLASANRQVTAQGGNLAATALYDPASGDFAQAIKILAAHYQKTGFDALLIAEGGQKLRQMAPLLVDSGLDPKKIRMLGTGLWQNDSGLNNEPGLAGGWYPALSPEDWQSFTVRYRQAFNSEPDSKAALAYDAVTLAIARALLPSGRDYSVASFTDAKGFRGASGLFRLIADGKVEHGMAILELGSRLEIGTNGNVIDPAPTAFAAVIN